MQQIALRPVTQQTIDQILCLTARLEHVEVDDVRGTCRVQNVVRARRACVRLLRKRGLTYREIGQALNRHHTTVMYYVLS